MTSPPPRAPYSLSGSLTSSLLLSASFYNAFFQSLFGVPFKSAYIFSSISITVNNHTHVDNTIRELQCRLFSQILSLCIKLLMGPHSSQSNRFHLRKTYFSVRNLFLLPSLLSSRLGLGICVRFHVLYAKQLHQSRHKAGGCYVFVKR